MNEEALAELFKAIAVHVARELAPIIERLGVVEARPDVPLERIAALEARKPEKGDKGDPGRLEAAPKIKMVGRVLSMDFGEGGIASCVAEGLPQDAGVFKIGGEYQPGDLVTYAGSSWIALAATAEVPGTGDGWRLQVKRGRDGRDLKATG